MTCGMGKICINLTWALLLLSNYFTIAVLLGRSFTTKPHDSISLWNLFSCFTTFGKIFFLFYEYLICIALICHLRAVFGDPGKIKSFIPASPPTGFVSPHFCKLCGYRWKPPRAHHCRKCQTCIFRMDHHCTWINNCVGIMNQKFFILFLIYTALLCLYQLFLLILVLFLWISHRPLAYSFFATVCLILLLAESIVFLYITTDFLCEQIESFETNSTLVESHQHTRGLLKSLSETLTEVFGQRSFYWCLPTLPTIKLDYSEPVFLTKSAAFQLQLKKNRQLKQRHSEASINTLGYLPRIKLIRRRQKPSILNLSNLEENWIQQKNDNDGDNNIIKNNMIHPTETQATKTRKSIQSPEISHWPPNQLYRNIYVKPLEDIGVYIDDDSGFISLDELQSDEFTDTDSSAVITTRHDNWDAVDSVHSVKPSEMLIMHQGADN